MKNRIAISTVVALAALFAVTTAEARPGKGKRDRGDRQDRMAERLDLTDSQKAKVAELREEMKTEKQAIRKEIKALRTKLKAEWTAKSPNEDRIISLQKKIHALKGEMGILRTEFKIDMFQILDEDQKEKFRQSAMKKKQS